MKSVVSVMTILLLLCGCKKEVLQSKNTSAQSDLTGTWQADYLGDKLSLEITGEQCEMTVPYIIKKDAASAPLKGFIKLTGHYSQSSSERLLEIDNLAAEISASSPVSSQDAWNMIKNLNVVVHSTNGTLKDSLPVMWKDRKLSF